MEKKFIKLANNNNSNYNNNNIKNNNKKNKKRRNNGDQSNNIVRWYNNRYGRDRTADEVTSTIKSKVRDIKVDEILNYLSYDGTEWLKAYFNPGDMDNGCNHGIPDSIGFPTHINYEHLTYSYECQENIQYLFILLPILGTPLVVLYRTSGTTNWQVDVNSIFLSSQWATMEGMPNNTSKARMTYDGITVTNNSNLLIKQGQLYVAQFVADLDVSDQTITFNSIPNSQAELANYGSMYKTFTSQEGLYMPLKSMEPVFSFTDLHTKTPKTVILNIGTQAINLNTTLGEKFFCAGMTGFNMGVFYYATTTTQNFSIKINRGFEYAILPMKVNQYPVKPPSIPSIEVLQVAARFTAILPTAYPSRFNSWANILGAFKKVGTALLPSLKPIASELASHIPVVGNVASSLINNL